MSRTPISTVLVAALAVVGLSSSALAQSAGSSIVLNGEAVRVRWSDGDSFRLLEGEYADTSVRLGGYNTLESYGPVHRWGEWTGWELYRVAQLAKDFAQAGTWTCQTSGERDHYERLLVTCDDLTLAMAASGLGHLFVFDRDASAPADALAAQAGAQAARLGMWAKGVPSDIVTSLHSADEGGDSTYNRVVSVQDGSSIQRPHTDNYSVCQEVCIEEAGSCLTYVPFQQRYGGDRADCLRGGP